MQTLLTSPSLIDFILIFTVVEAAVLMFVGYRRRTRLGPSRSDNRIALSAAVVLMLLPGICLLLAVRAALAGTSWPWVPATLAAALVAHLLDLRLRWRS